MSNQYPGTARVRRMIKLLPKHNYVMSRAMLEAGYSKGYSHNPHRLKATKGYNRLMSQELGKIKELRTSAIHALDEKNPADEDYKVLVEALDKYTKIIQLLEGKPTEITETSTRGMTDAELDAKLAELEQTDEEETKPEGDNRTGEAEEGESQA